MQGQQLGEIFVRSGLITQDQLQSALDKQRQLGSQEQIGDVLVGMRLISEQDRVRALGDQWGVAFVDLGEQTIAPEALACVTQELARRYKVIPVQLEGARLTLAMKNPLDIFAIDEIRLITGKDVEPVIATEESIILAITDAYKGGGTAAAVEGVLRDFQDGVTLDSGRPDDEMSIEELKELSDQAPVVRLANMIISRGIAEHCSDIHIEPAKDCLKVRYRVDGILQDGLIVPKKAQASPVSYTHLTLPTTPYV